MVILSSSLTLITAIPFQDSRLWLSDDFIKGLTMEFLSNGGDAWFPENCIVNKKKKKKNFFIFFLSTEKTKNCQTKPCLSSQQPFIQKLLQIQRRLPSTHCYVTHIGCRRLPSASHSLGGKIAFKISSVLGLVSKGGRLTPFFWLRRGRGAGICWRLLPDWFRWSPHIGWDSREDLVGWTWFENL